MNSEPLELIQLNPKKLSSIRAEWINETNEGDDLTLISTLFETIDDSKDFGSLTERSGLHTSLALHSAGHSKHLAIIQCSYYEKGLERICKIMDISHSPHVAHMEDEEYSSTHAKIIFSSIYHMLKVIDDAKRGEAKIYARDHTTRETIHFFESSAVSQVFTDLGYTVKLQGRNWLTIEKMPIPPSFSIQH